MKLLNKTLFFCLTTVLIFCTIPSITQAATISRDLVVDENTTIKKTDITMYGLNYEWNGFGICDKVTAEPNPAFVEGMKNYRFPFNRMAGTSSTFYIWKDCVGPVEKRTPFYQAKTISTIVGPLDWMKSVRTVDKNAKFIYVPNLAKDSFENCADLVELFTSDGTVNYNGGINWGLKRKEWGMEEPIEVIWELGNELDYTSETKWSVDTYIEVCNKAIDIIRKIDPDAKISCHADTTVAAAASDSTFKYHRRILQELGDRIDYISYHGYYPIGNVTRSMTGIQQISEDILSITGSDRIKIIVTEHATWVPNEVDWPLTHSMVGLVNSAEFYLRMMHYPQVFASTYHCNGPKPWATYFEEDGEIKPTAMSDLLELFMDYSLGDSLKSTLTGYESLKTTSTLLINGVSKTDDGINIIFSNRSEENDYLINMDFKHNYKLVETRVITGDNRASDNWYGKHEISIKTTQYDTNNVITSYTVPKLSIVALKLVRTDSALND